mmetsp:Transcript_13414/g.24305  ORF Transcript_13414/g.24305 Transcript_13414/m.24305 type:complete len:80 (+) Transcript_13414:2686-2925(+)
MVDVDSIICRLSRRDDDDRREVPPLEVSKGPTPPASISSTVIMIHILFYFCGQWSFWYLVTTILNQIMSTTYSYALLFC